MHSPREAHLWQLSCWSEQSPPAPTVLSNESTWIHFVADHFSPSITGHPAWRLSVSGVAVVWRLKNRSASPLRGFTMQYRVRSKKQSFRISWLAENVTWKYNAEEKHIKVIAYTVSHLLFLFWHTQRDHQLSQILYDEEIPLPRIIKSLKLTTRSRR